MHLAGAHLEVETVEGVDVTKGLVEAGDPDRVVHASTVRPGQVSGPSMSPPIAWYHRRVSVSTAFSSSNSSPRISHT